MAKFIGVRVFQNRVRMKSSWRVGADKVLVDVSMEINVDNLIADLGQKAFLNKSKRTKLASGDIVVTAKLVPEVDPSPSSC